VTTNPIYEEIATSAGMDAVNIDANIGKMYRYTGVTDTKYVNGRLYWVVVGTPSLDYLCFTANTAGSVIASYIVGTLTNTPTIEYSTDKTNWSPFTFASTAITLANIGDKVYFRGDNTTFSKDNSNYIEFYMEGSIAASGNIMSLLDKTVESVIVPDAAFYCLFNGCSSLTSAPTLPATTVGHGGYANLFAGCTNLTTAPELAMTSMGDSACYRMFYGCTNLTTAPSILKPTTATYTGYQDMFRGCSVLTTVPILSATTLNIGCYASMFRDCAALTYVPELKATTIAEGAYYNMFNGCTSLYVSDTSGTSYDKAWAIPASGIASGDYEMENMFVNCLGTRSSDSPNFNGIQKTYYTQNTPVAPVVS